MKKISSQTFIQCTLGTFYYGHPNSPFYTGLLYLVFNFRRDVISLLHFLSELVVQYAEKNIDYSKNDKKISTGKNRIYI